MDAARHLRRCTAGQDRANPSLNRVRSRARDGQGRRQRHAIALGCDQRPSRGMHVLHRAGRRCRRGRPDAVRHAPTVGRA